MSGATTAILRFTYLPGIKLTIAIGSFSGSMCEIRPLGAAIFSVGFVISGYLALYRLLGYGGIA
ncbi:MAG: hypothetical protein V3V95_02835, partial [Thermodesulfobacteriota bacterium]